MGEVEAGRVQRLCQIALGMRIAAGLEQAERLSLGIALDRQGEQSSRREPFGDLREQRVELTEIGEDVGGGDQVEATSFKLELAQIRLPESIVDALPSRLVQHRLRDVHPFDKVANRPQPLPHQTGSATQVHGAGKTRPSKLGEGARKQLGSAIAEPIDQRGIEARRVLVEQGLDEGARHARLLRAASDKLKPEAGPGMIDRIELERSAPGPLGLVHEASPVEHLASAIPAKHPVRRELQGGRHHFGGCGGITFSQEHLGEVGTAGGQPVAGGQLQFGQGAIISRKSPEYRRVDSLFQVAFPQAGLNYVQAVRPQDLLKPRPEGLYCPPGDFYIDPVRPVPRALVTHGHSDHARAGHESVLATRQTLDIMALRYGEAFAGSRQVAELGERLSIGGVSVIFHPAGHVLGSAQIEVGFNGLTIVASGDYKRSSDPTCAAFQPVRCHVFITEATFGLPVFRHPLASHEIARLLRSAGQFPDRSHVVGAYALGKAQRVMRLLREAGYDRPIYIHGALAAITDYYRTEGIELGQIEPATVETGKSNFAGAVIIGPPSAFADRWARRFADPISCFASGWMRIRQRAKQGGVELPLIISDHADWSELTATIRQTGASEVWVTHGREEALVRWCELQGIMARPLHLVGYEDEND